MEGDGYLFGSARIVFGDRTWWWRTLIIGGFVALGTFSGGVALAADVFRSGYGALMIRDMARGEQRRWPRFTDVGGIAVNTLYSTLVLGAWILPLVFVGTALVLVLLPQVAEIVDAGTPYPLWFAYLITGGFAVMEVLPNVAVMRAVASSRLSAGFSPRGVMRLIVDPASGFLGATGVLFASAGVAIALDMAPRLASAVGPGSMPVGPSSIGWRIVTAFIMVPIEMMVMAAYGVWASRAGLANPSGEQGAVRAAPIAHTRLQDILVPASADAGSWREKEQHRGQLSAIRAVQAGVVRDVREGKPSLVFSEEDSAAFHLDSDEQLIWAFGGAKWIDGPTANAAEPFRPPQAGYYESGKFTRLPAVPPDDEGAREGVLGIGSRHLSFVSADVWHRVPYSDIASIGAYRDGVGLQRRQDPDGQLLLVTGDGWAAYNLIANLVARCSAAEEALPSDAIPGTAQREALDPAAG